jgi:hypothetical protein
MLHPLYNWSATFVRADIFMGTYETSEMIDVTESSYELDDDGNVLSRN